MVDYTARTSYRGTAEYSPSSQRTRRSAYDEARANEVRDALREASTGSGSRQEVGAGPAARQDSAASVSDRSVGWTIFSKKDSGTAAAATTAAPAPAAENAAPPAKPLTDADVVQALKDALMGAGVSVENLGLAAHEDVVTYPGGSYINRYISVTTNGHVEGLMTDLVAIDPRVAVLDIRRMLGMG